MQVLARAQCRDCRPYIVLGRLIVITTCVGLTTSRATGLTALLASLDRVNLAVGKAVLLHTLVWLAVLAEAVVLRCISN